jgi:tyrosine-protein kinase Etk/Wzc
MQHTENTPKKTSNLEPDSNLEPEVKPASNLGPASNLEPEVKPVSNLEPASNLEPEVKPASNLEPGSNLEPEVKPASTPDLLDYLAILIKRWKLIVGITATVTIVTIIHSLTLPNIYTAKTKMLPPQQSSGLLSAAMMQGALGAALGGSDILGDSKATKLYSELLKVEALRDPIIERFKLQELYKNKYRQDVYKMLNKNVIITAGKEGIITISVDDTDPKRATEMANAFVDELKKISSKMAMTGAGNTKAFLEERIAKTKDELTQTENNLKAFQQKYKTLDATNQGAASAGAIASLTAQLTSQEIQLAVLRRTYAESSQEVKTLRQAISVLQEKIARLESGGTGSLAGLEKASERGQEYLHLMRKFKVTEAVYETLTRQYEMARLNAENDVSTIQVIQKALVPERKSKPARSKMVITACFAAFFFSVLLVFVLENFTGMDEKAKERWKSIAKL